MDKQTESIQTPGYIQPPKALNGRNAWGIDEEIWSQHAQEKKSEDETAPVQ